jgi:hypothetical protein
MTKYIPTKETIAFAAEMVRIMNHDGVWHAPMEGLTYRFDKQNKIISLIAPATLTPDQQEDHERTVAVFGAVGYTVQDARPIKIPPNADANSS